MRYQNSVVLGYNLEFQIGSNSPHSVFPYRSINFYQYSLFPRQDERSSSVSIRPYCTAIYDILLNGSFRCITEFNKVLCISTQIFCYFVCLMTEHSPQKTLFSNPAFFAQGGKPGFTSHTQQQVKM
jgi:hypothetical protein